MYLVNPTPGLESLGVFIDLYMRIPILYVMLMISLLPLNIKVARSFGRSTTFGVFISIFPFLFIPMIGFSKDRYLGVPINKNTVNNTDNEK